MFQEGPIIMYHGYEIILKQDVKTQCLYIYMTEFPPHNKLSKRFVQTIPWEDLWDKESFKSVKDQELIKKIIDQTIGYRKEE